MFDNLVTYHIHKREPLPANDALAYQYVLAGNGVFVRAKTHLFTALLPVTACTVCGLPPLRSQFQLLVPGIPARLLDAVLVDARCARRPDGGRPHNGLNEVLYQFHHHGRAVQVKKPAQEATPTSVTTAVADADTIICDLHSHGNMRAFFSQTDNTDEQGARLYAVIGRLDSEPEMRLRVGVYGYWLALPLTPFLPTTAPSTRPAPLGRSGQAPSKIYIRRKKMTNNGYNNGHAANDDYTGFTYELEEPIAVKGFSVTYARKFNTGNLVDHDLVELKNCGRQAVSLQSALAGGVPKVADLALRLNAAYGLDIAAWPQPYIMDMARGWFHHGAGGRSRAHPGDLVDNHRLRRRGQSSGLDQPQQQNQKEHGQKKWDKSVSSLLVNLDGPLL